MVAYRMYRGRRWVPTLMNCLRIPTLTTFIRRYSPRTFSTKPSSVSFSKWYTARAGLEKTRCRWTSLGPTRLDGDRSRCQYTRRVLPFSWLATFSSFSLESSNPTSASHPMDKLHPAYTSYERKIRITNRLDNGCVTLSKSSTK